MAAKPAKQEARQKATAAKNAAAPEKAARPGSLKLNLGAGPNPMPGYVNLDRKTGQEIYPLAYEDNSVDEIRASHCLEHFSHRETLDVIKDWVAKLKPGGLLKIAVPDMEAISSAYMQRIPWPVEGFLMGGHVDSDDYHGAMFDKDKLCKLFHAAGLERVKHFVSDHADCTRLPISLNMQAYKPAAGKMKFEGVHACLASARYGPALHHQCIYQAMMKLELRMHTVTGCFWHQHLSEAIESELVDANCRYILTLDFDTVFSHEDVFELYRIMETHPHIDALVSVQSKRGASDALFTMADDAGKLLKEVHAGIFDQLTAPIHTGHFGLTMLRADKLRALPRPWMLAKPDPEGRWRDGREDSDISFWTNWRKQGNTIHLANKVAVGHVQEMIMWPGQDFKPVFQDSARYINDGKPPEAR